jgi:OOP family OmpA-OmpF porin
MNMNRPSAVAPACATALLIALTGATSAIAADGYAVSGGNVVRSTFGDCWRTSTWSKESAIEQCDPDLVPKPEPMAVFEPEPAPVEVAAAVAAKQVTITLDGASTFAFDSADLTAADRDAIRQVANQIRRYEDEIEAVTVAGYTDSTGPAAYNQGLSERRAEAVKNLLISEGVDPDKVKTVAYGETDPVASNATREGRARNRRTNVTVEGVTTDEIVIEKP